MGNGLLEFHERQFIVFHPGIEILEAASLLMKKILVGEIRVVRRLACLYCIKRINQNEFEVALVRGGFRKWIGGRFYAVSVIFGYAIQAEGR